MKMRQTCECSTPTFQHAGDPLRRGIRVGLGLAVLLIGGSVALSNAHQLSLRQWQARAIAGDVQAQYHLGRLYADGEGVRQSHKQAGFWYRQAAEQGHALAQNKLGVMYERGAGVPQDIIEAYKWFALAAGSNANIYAVVNRDALARRMTLEQLLAGHLRTSPMVAKRPPSK